MPTAMAEIAEVMLSSGMPTSPITPKLTATVSPSGNATSRPATSERRTRAERTIVVGTIGVEGVVHLPEEVDVGERLPDLRLGIEPRLQVGDRAQDGGLLEGALVLTLDQEEEGVRAGQVLVDDRVVDPDRLAGAELALEAHVDVDAAGERQASEHDPDRGREHAPPPGESAGRPEERVEQRVGRRLALALAALRRRAHRAERPDHGHR